MSRKTRGYMSNTALKENVRKKSQKGVALLFALGILGLLLVMALGFATNSIFDQMIANNNGNSSSARTIAQSGLERVRNMLQNYAEKIRDMTGANNFTADGIYGYSHSGDTSVLRTNALTDPGNSDTLKDFFSSYLYTPANWVTNSMGNNINWIYLKADGKLAGRMSYIILNRADLDPGKLVSSAIDEASASGGNPAPLEKRLGVDASEINLFSINPDPLVETPAITQAVAGKFNYTGTGLGGEFNGNSWIDLPFLFYRFGFNPSNAADKALMTKFTRWFVCNSQNSPEAYWVDLNGDNKITSDEQFHRFNLARTDWSAFITSANDMYEKILLDANHDGTPDFNPAAAPGSTIMHYTSTASDGYGIPWLAFFGYDKNGAAYTGADLTEMKGTFSLVADRRRQIAANLVEYCMPPPITATDTHSAISDSTDWLTTAPKFTGNMKTPYINEIGGHVQVKSTILANLPKYNISIDLKFWLYSELINIYATAWPRLPSSAPASTLRLNVTGSFIYDYNIGKVAPVTDVTVPINLDVDAFSWSGGAGLGYGTSIDVVTAVPSSPVGETIPIIDNNVPGGLVKAIISNVRFTINRAVLYEPGTPNVFYDYAGINQTSTLASLQSYTPTASDLSAMADGTTISDTKDGWFSFETEDPRQNLNPGSTGDWTAQTANVDNLNNPAVWTAIPGAPVLGKVNTNSSPAGHANVDVEPVTVTDPVNGNMSTAFIRNGPMVSPWELGFIHRGAKWQTLNLHEYDVNKAKNYVAGATNIIPGGGKYSDTIANGGGDANILDQIKMNSSASNYKVDLNNEFQDPDTLLSNRYIVFYALFKNIKSGSSMTNTAPGIDDATATAVSDANIGSIITGIISRTVTGATTNTYKTRAQVVNDIAAVEPILTTYNSKAKKDEIIGKMINLVDFDSYYTVILVVQTIKDVGGPVGTPITINKKLPGDTANTAITAELGKFDMVVSGGKNYYADEITSTLKVQAIVHKKIDGTCEVLNVKYIQ